MFNRKPTVATAPVAVTLPSAPKSSPLSCSHTAEELDEYAKVANALGYHPDDLVFARLKTIIHIVGAGATGKSSLTRAICGPGGVENATKITVDVHHGDSKQEERVKWTVFPNGYSIAGNLKNTSDCISSMNALRCVVGLCLYGNDAGEGSDVVVIDPVRCSHGLIDWIQDQRETLRAVFVYLTLPLEENLRRLRARRSENGKSTELSAKTLANVDNYRSRAASVWRYAQEHYTRFPNYFVEICPGFTIEKQADFVRHLMSSVDQIEAELVLPISQQVIEP